MRMHIDRRNLIKAIMYGLKYGYPAICYDPEDGEIRARTRGNDMRGNNPSYIWVELFNLKKVGLISDKAGNYTNSDKFNAREAAERIADHFNVH